MISSVGAVERASSLIREGTKPRNSSLRLLFPTVSYRLPWNAWPKESREGEVLLHNTACSRSLAIILVAVVTAACHSGDAGEPYPHLSPIHIVAGAAVTDTIQSVPAQALIV